MASKSLAVSRARIAKCSGAKRPRDAWDSTNATADRLLLDMIEFERLTILFIEEGLMSCALGVDFRASARRSQREVLLCLHELAATNAAALRPGDEARFRASLGTWRAMREIGRRTLRRLDIHLAET